MGCGVAMPLEDGHVKCVLCLGHQHATLSREAPDSCMDCFIMPARTREARCRFFGAKRAGPPLSDMTRGKTGRLTEATRGQGAHPEPWPATLAPSTPRPSTSRSRVGPLPPPIPVLEMDEEEEEEEEDDVDIETVFSSDDNGVSCGQQLPGDTWKGEVARHFAGVISRATRALDVALPEHPSAPASRFEEDGDVRPIPSQVPLLPDFKDLVCKQFATPAVRNRPSTSCRRLSDMQNKEQVACGSLPPVDPALTPLVSPSSSVLGRATCPSRNCRVMDGLLAKLHRAMATQTGLANTGAIMSLYVRHLSRQVQDASGGSSAAGELQAASSCLSSVMKEQAEAAGRALASFWVVRRHLWLSQSQLQQGDRDCLLRLPVDPSAVFGPDAARLLQQARENRRCAQEVSGSLLRPWAVLRGGTGWQCHPRYIFCLPSCHPILFPIKVSILVFKHSGLFP